MRLLIWNVAFLMKLYVLLSCRFLIVPEQGDSTAVLQVCGLLQPLDWGLEGY